MRLFAAVWPPPGVLDHLDLALATVRGVTPGADDAPVRWSARETWHLTMAFYGDVPDGAVPAMDDELRAAAAATAPYALHLRGAGVFAHRTLWVGVGGDVDAHRALTAAAVAATPSSQRVDTAERSRAHLTVGRAVRPVGGGRGPGRRAQRGRGQDRGPVGGATRVSPLGVARGSARGSAPRGAAWPGGADLPPSPDVDVLAHALAVYDGPTWTVEALTLVESRPGAGRGGGPLYVVVAEHPLTGDVAR
jgi:2'-5' RNA ligase